MARTSRRGVRFAVATTANEAALRQLLRTTPMHGTIALSFEREPDYFRGDGVADAEDQTIAAFAYGTLVCMGRCTTRPCWLNGETRRVGYLGELRLAEPVHGRFDLLCDGYRFFHELAERNRTDFHFTSIAADNVRARRLLERGARGLPRYEFLTEFATLVLPTATFGAASLESEAEHPDEVAAFLNYHGRRTQLAPAWTEERLNSLARHGLPPEAIRVFRRDGRMVAVATVWDQRSFRQTVIHSYASPLRQTRPLFNVAAPWIGQPRLPAPGSVLSHAYVSLLALTNDSVELLPQVLTTLGQEAASRGIEFLTLGFPAADPRLAQIRRRWKGRTYASRLYRVIWPGEKPLALDPRPFAPEIGFL